MEYIGHTSDDGRKQLLLDHLNGTSKLCRENANEFWADIAEFVGQIHDIGKYTSGFQKRINGAENIRVEHAICGAKEVAKAPPKSYVPMIEYCVAGHHSGLPDGGTKVDGEEDSTLHGRMKRKTGDYSAYENEVKLEYPKDNLRELFDVSNQREIIERYSFFTRYLFSCLTDADFIDTERFVTPNTDRGIDGDFQKAYEKVCKKLNSFKIETKLQESRSIIQEQVYKSVESNANVYTLNMPTGSGKTLCSIRAALKTAIENKKKRIIYVIPYVSIIEQTAKVFEDIFGDVLPVLQHHSNYDFDDDKNEDENEITSEKLKRSCENWDAKLIVTTNIQFFESLYHYKGRRLRKLHNLADSVIIFDEIHMLPIDYIQPCLRAIGYVTKYLNSTAILMSATMPNYDKFMERYMSGVKIENAVKDTSLFNVFDKCRYEYIGKCELASLAEKAQEYDNALIIVNKRKTARELYDICSGNKYHLSTYMTPLHRSEIIAKIKEDIKNGINTTVISTSLIEAGVDLDFKAVFREIAGIDNILQSGGRCNREGKMDMGDVFVFETDGGNYQTKKKSDIIIRANITRNLFEEFENISTDKCIKEYYGRLLNYKEKKIEENTITAIMGNDLRIDGIPFRTYAESFNFIDNQVIGIVIPCDENRGLIKELKDGKLSVKRNLQRYSASVNKDEFKELFQIGIIETLDCGVCILANTDYYKSDVGLALENDVNYFV
ncbi:MAG: CRISPR-associated helicase Cas3' [Firmicutes bacterium]|nr:CRISPR-associated helicase Cas3' [Bacillota bacterium]